MTVEPDNADQGVLLGLLYASGQKLRDTDIADAIRELSKLLISGRVAAVDAILDAAQPRKMSIEMMITLLRTSYAARNSLRGWSKLVERAEDEVRRRGRDPVKVFRGLSPVR
jgi:hypothetical protein